VNKYEDTVNLQWAEAYCVAMRTACYSQGWASWWWQLEPYDAQSSHQIINTNKPTPSFYRPDALPLPVAQPTVSEHWRKKSLSTRAHPKLTWSLSTLSLTTKSSWLPWWRVAKPLISPLMPVPHRLKKVPYKYDIILTRHRLITNIHCNKFNIKFW